MSLKNYDATEYVVRQVARGAIAAGKELEFLAWVQEFFHQEAWREDCMRIYTEELDGFIRLNGKESSCEKIG